jgi:rhodanese-related sulfurtransferase
MKLKALEFSQATINLYSIFSLFTVLSIFTSTPAMGAPVAPDSDSNFEQIRNKASIWLTDINGDIPIKSSRYVKSWVVDQWDSQQDEYQIVSVRSKNHFKMKGHIANADNIPWQMITSPDNIDQLDSMKTVIVYSDIGYQAGVASVVLNLLDYKTINMKFGMMDWNLQGLVNKPWDKHAGYVVETKNNKSDTSYKTPVLTGLTGSLEDIISLQYVNNVAPKPVFISSQQVKQIIDDWPKNKSQYQIISVRENKDYLAGHIPHSINIPWHEITNKDKLRLIDPEKKIIVYCYTGHLAEVSATLLNLLGYDVINLRFGMMDWNSKYVKAATQWDGEASHPLSLQSP